MRFSVAFTHYSVISMTVKCQCSDVFFLVFALKHSLVSDFNEYTNECFEQTYILHLRLIVYGIWSFSVMRDEQSWHMCDVFI